LPRDLGDELPIPDPLPQGERCPGEVVFQSPETIVETGLPFARRYDANDELWRIRQIYAREASAPPRRSPQPFQRRSLRRVSAWLLEDALTIEASRKVEKPKPDKAAIDRREINRRAVKFWPQVRSMLVDMHGRPIGDLARLSPHYDAAQRADGRKRHGAPKLDTFRGPDPCPNADGSGPGAWCDVGTGKSGTDAISLIEYLGECDRKTATEFLKDLTDRLVELTAWL
jgi:hypothetical protein